MKTARYLSALACGAILSAGVATPTFAATTIAGSVSGISFHGADPGLVVYANPLAFSSFSLNPGETHVVDVLNIGTNEGSVQFFEDTVPYPISVNFAFTDPTGATGAPVNGSTVGYFTFFGSCSLFGSGGGCGAVNWGSPSVFNFGTGGQFSVGLLDASFGTPGNANVQAKFKLISDSTPAVPEPSTWAMLLIGFGAIGAALRRRQQTLTVSYA